MMFHSIPETLNYLSNKDEAKKEMKRLEEDNALDKIYRWFSVASLVRTV